MRASSFAIAIAAVALFASACGCGSARRSEPVAGPAQLAGEAVRGHVLFMRHCHECHPGGAAGLGPALNNKPLPAVAIKTQIRQGFGAMPAFSDEQIDDQDVSSIVAYLGALRDNER